MQHFFFTQVFYFFSTAITSQPEETVAVESENVKTQETDQTIDKESESTQEEEKKDKNNGGGWFSNWGVSDLAKKVTDTVSLSCFLMSLHCLI